MEEISSGIKEVTRLWINVVIQALIDYSSASKNPKDIIYKEQALAWFKNNSTDYQEVCLNANIDPEYLRTTVLKADVKALKKLIEDYQKEESTKEELCYAY
jgi:hypothetical protein